MLDLPLERLLEALAEGPVESESAPDGEAVPAVLRALEGLHLLSGAAHVLNRNGLASESIRKKKRKKVPFRSWWAPSASWWAFMLPLDSRSMIGHLVYEVWSN